MTHQGVFIADAVVHCYNWLRENHRIPLAQDFAEASYRLHSRMSDDRHRLTQDEYISDWQPEQLAELMFAESDTDFAVYHAVPLDDYYKDGLISIDKGIRFRADNPHRTALYGNVNPLDTVRATELVEYYGQELKVDGIKIYPVRYHSGRSLQIALDDRKLVFPIIEAAAAQGIRTVAVHKAIPFGRTAQSYYRVDDIDEAAAAFPELNFEVVHAGMAFTEETAFLLARHPNVYANLEVTSTLIVNQPRRFAEVLGQLLYWGGPDRILFATGAHFVHPQPVIEAFWNFQFPEEFITGYGYPRLTDEIKAKILGANLMRMLGRDIDDIKARAAGDQWDQRRADGLDEPWTSRRSVRAQQPPPKGRAAAVPADDARTLGAPA
ncbi:amidohydrolase family protein [Plantactinospora sp. GCM10030261]|uniref:amidohydrolase family protein n=1 Tax=Plantactinospora sp. GCM10030261 TaxID=3273420 RepID=UPI003619C243